MIINIHSFNNVIYRAGHYQDLTPNDLRALTKKALDINYDLILDDYTCNLDYHLRKTSVTIVSDPTQKMIMTDTQLALIYGPYPYYKTKIIKAINDYSNK